MVLSRRLKIYGSVVGIVCVTVLCLGTAGEFTEKRTKKNPSMATLKEECCESWGIFLKEVPQLLNHIALVQAKALAVIQGYWESDKQSWCEQASRQKLEACRNRLCSVQNKINDLLLECAQLLKEI